MIFGIKEKCIILTFNIFLVIVTNILQRLKTGFVVQGHICIYIDADVFNCSYTHWWTDGVLTFLPLPYDEGDHFTHP